MSTPVALLAGFDSASKPPCPCGLFLFLWPFAFFAALGPDAYPPGNLRGRFGLFDYVPEKRFQSKNEHGTEKKKRESRASSIEDSHQATFADWAFFFQLLFTNAVCLSLLTN